MRSFSTLAKLAKLATLPVLALLALLTLGASGCTDPEPSSGAPLAQLEQGLLECPEDVCGSNSPNIENHGFHELNLLGVPNAQQMRITGAQLDGSPVQLSVEKAQLIATTAIRGRLRDAALIGLRISLQAYVQDQLSTFELEIVAARRLRYAMPDGTKDFTGAYIVEYFDSTGARRNLCTPIGGGRPDLPPDEAFGQLSREAIFFEGDRIDTTRMTIDRVVDSSWFNIGCAGHTLAKLHLTRNTTPSSVASMGYTHGDRQATLKMFVADYCGTGKPFTVAGQPLTWRDSQGLMSFFGRPTTFEARWTARGAACIGEPRMLYPFSEEAAGRYPDIMASIARECPLLLQQPCSHDLYDFGGRTRVSGNREF